MKASDESMMILAFLCATFASLPLCAFAVDFEGKCDCPACADNVDKG